MELTSKQTNKAWTERVWADAEPRWLVRDGQDNFYRKHVVIPGIIRLIKRHVGPAPFEFLDVGCGDGYSTDRLILAMRQAGLAPKRVLLIDRSERQLRLATKHPSLYQATTLRCDLDTPGWFQLVPKRVYQRIVVSIFVAQELTDLQPLVSGLSRITDSHDNIFFLTVAPRFSAQLKRRNLILELTEGETGDDWRWRGLYPIDGAAGRLYLPHFQRTIRDYKYLISSHGLFRCVGVDYLAVPDHDKSRWVFSKTIYGRNIIGTHSSVVISAQRTPTCQEVA